VAVYCGSFTKEGGIIYGNDGTQNANYAGPTFSMANDPLSSAVYSAAGAGGNAAVVDLNNTLGAGKNPEPPYTAGNGWQD
jgi:hypothetical protein